MNTETHSRRPNGLKVTASLLMVGGVIGLMAGTALPSESAGTVGGICLAVGFAVFVISRFRE